MCRVSVSYWKGRSPALEKKKIFLYLAVLHLGCTAAFRSLVPQWDWTPHLSCITRWTFNHWTTRGSPVPYFLSPPFPKGMGLLNPGHVSGCPLSLSVRVLSLGPERPQEARDGIADSGGWVGQACRWWLQTEKSASRIRSHRRVLRHVCTQAGNHRSNSPADHQGRNRWDLCQGLDQACGPRLQKWHLCVSGRIKLLKCWSGRTRPHCVHKTNTHTYMQGAGEVVKTRG